VQKTSGVFSKLWKKIIYLTSVRNINITSKKKKNASWQKDTRIRDKETTLHELFLKIF